MNKKKISTSKFNKGNNSYLTKKRRRFYQINENELYENDNKKKILKRLVNLFDAQDQRTEEKKYNELISFLDSKKEGDIINDKQFIELTNLNDISNITLREKYEDGFLLTYENGLFESIYIYKTPKILGQIFNSNLTIDLCYTNIQSENAIIKHENLDVEKYAIIMDENNQENIICNNIEILKSKEILLIMNNKINFDVKSLDPKKLFTNNLEYSEKEKPTSINLGFFYYFDIIPENQNHYFFINSSRRKNFKNTLIKFILSFEQTSYYMTGPGGIGKSASLIFFAGLKIFHILYINFQLIFKQKLANTKIMLKYEIMRFFIIDYKSTNIYIKKINKLINEMDIENLQDFFRELTKNLLGFYGPKEKKVFIFDQYSEEIRGFNLHTFLNEIKDNENFKIIISTSLNNEFTKEGINNSLNHENDSIFKMNFYSNLLDNKKDSSLLLENESNEILKNELLKYGNLPKYYYLLKEKNNKLDSINQNIENDIKNYINNDLSIILELLILIKNDYIFQGSKIKEHINSFTLRYISITKKQIYYKKNDEDNKYLFYFDKNYTQSIKISKFYEKFFIHCIANNNYQIDRDIENHFFFEDFLDDIFDIEFKPNKKLSEKIYKKYYQFFYENKVNNNQAIIKDGFFIIYKMDFLFQYIKVIFYKIIFEYIHQSMKNLSTLINLSTEGGIFEILVTYDIISKEKLFDIEITDFIEVKSFVPQNYSIKIFSSRQKNKLIEQGKQKIFDYNMKKLIGEEEEKKIVLENKPILIIQQNCNGKYYDIGILIPVNDDDTENLGRKKFKLILFQISIKKPSKKWLENQEHEINFVFIKKNLENKYSIEIVSGYFYYILKKENGLIKDNDTYNNNKKKCILYDIQKGFSNDYLLFNDNSFITDKFLIFNECSLMNNNKNLSCSTKIRNMIINPYEEINEVMFEIFNESIKNINPKKSLSKDQFHIIGRENMTDSIKSLTSFFIFTLKKGEKFIIYLNGEKKELDKCVHEKYLCVVSDYEVTFI